MSVRTTPKTMFWKKIFIGVFVACAITATITWYATMRHYQYKFESSFFHDPYVMASVTATMIFATQYILAKIRKCLRRWCYSHSIPVEETTNQQPAASGFKMLESNRPTWLPTAKARAKAALCS